MSLMHHPQQAIAPAPPSLAIPYGKFIDIDAQYHKLIAPEETDSFSRGRRLVHGNADVNVQPTAFVEHSPSLALDSGSLRVNYMGYLYNQKSGFDAHHGREVKMEPQPVFF